MTGEFERALETAERLLDAFAAAANGAGSDELSALHAPLRQALAGLASSAPNEIDRQAQARLRWLRLRSDTLAAFMLRHQSHTAHALRSLSSGSPRLRALTRGALYGAGGQMLWSPGR